MRLSGSPEAALTGALSMSWVFAITACEIELTEKNHPILGALLSLLFTACLLIAVLYWTSSRFSAGDTRRSLADFKDWSSDCLRDAWTMAKLLMKWGSALAIVVGLTVAGYQFADRKGRVTHYHKTPVWVQGNWMVGESRDCDMPRGVTRLFCSKSPTNGSGLAEFPEAVSDGDLWTAVGAAYNRHAQTDWSSLDRYFNVLPVRFHGRIQSPERDRPSEIETWRCQRNTKRLTCEPLD